MSVTRPRQWWLLDLIWSQESPALTTYDIFFKKFFFISQEFQEAIRTVIAGFKNLDEFRNLVRTLRVLEHFRNFLQDLDFMNILENSGNFRRKSN